MSKLTIVYAIIFMYCLNICFNYAIPTEILYRYIKILSIQKL